MIEYLKGTLVSLTATQAIIECAGVGYALEISLTTQGAMPPAQADHSVSTTLWVHEVIREDEHLLFGFADQRERALFRLLISVNGVGPNTARIMLSTLSVGELAGAIADEDVRTIKHVKGIGAKTAERVIVELKDKMTPFVGTTYIASTSAESANTLSTNKAEALTALTMLGYTKTAAEKVLSTLKPTLTTEELIKEALQKL
ncbi:MAG: Holliday junction branch migration protein RuvA [Bacteroidales bacterium]|nr:Holliday junction branch migration protein RuvA [Candidatus Colimorpha onthohippi]